MMRKTLALLLALSLTASFALAVPNLMEKSGELTLPPALDTYDDTLYYDNNQIQWWYGGLLGFRLATKFTPLDNFEMQKILIAMADSSLTNPVNLYLKDPDPVSGFPGTTLWSGTMIYNLAYTWLTAYVDTFGAYSFTAGQDFWIELQSPGPPYEIYDPSPVIPQRSYTMFPGGTTWSNSPGDNFIRAVGEYTGPGIIDVGIDSVWHGQNYFVTNGTGFQVGCKAKNYGAAPAIFTIGCVIYTEMGQNNYVYFDSLALQSAMLAPGASANYTFPSYTWNVNNRYKIDVRAYMTGDVFPDNNIRSIETQVYSIPPAAELRYDDDTVDGHAYSSTIGMGWGMKFNPHQTGSYSIDQIKVEVSYSVGDSAARVRLLADDADAPGTILWETVQTMANGWNTFNTNVSNSGAFYIMYFFEHGASTSALGMDGYPGSGQGWEFSGGAYFSDPQADDWAMRAVIDEEGVYPDVTIDLTYVSGSPVPAPGGPIVYDVTVDNNEATSQTFDAWIGVTLPTGSEVILINRELTLPASQTVQRQLTLNVPAGAPGGAYTMTGYVGDYPAPIWDQSSFPFTKSGDGDGFTDPSSWVLDGWDEPWSAVVPDEFAVLGNYPNPFNPITTISYTLPEAGKVTLAVYDISGRLVASLVDGYRDAGVHEVTFDASQLSSGIYVYRLTANGQTISAKMVLMK